MQLLLLPVIWLAVVGFVASVLVHVLALTGVPSPFGSATWWYLSGGVIVVWIPALLVQERLSGNDRRADFIKTVLRGCPAWIRNGAYIVGAYGLANFLLFVFQAIPYPKNAVPEVIIYRGVSGHWMVFYYMGAAVLYSGSLRQNRPRHCVNGHVVSRFSRDCCDVCGSPIAKQG